jgi:antibiotic biosynthesis monooxygenase (ABM) superfamily enzyme
MIKSTATSFEIASVDKVPSSDFNRWLTDFAYGALALKGFFSAGIIPPEFAPSEIEEDEKLPAVWSVIHRFDSDEACSVWLNSLERKSQIDGLASAFCGQVQERAASA